MANIIGRDADQYAQIVQGVGEDTSFEVGVGANELPMTPQGKKAFTDLTDGDVICYFAISLEDPTKWEFGKVAYDGTNKQLDRLDASVVASSNSNNTVNFKRADGSGMNVLVTGVTNVNVVNAWTVTNFAADRTISATEATVGQVAASLATLVNDLIDADVITGTVS